MRDLVNTGVRLLLAGVLAVAVAPSGRARTGKHPTDLADILAQMNEASKHLQTVSCNLDYTKVTVLVNDKSTESGQLYFRKGKTLEIRIDFDKPDRKTLLVKKNTGEFYLPNINQIQEYDLSQKSDLIQQFFLLGFGTDAGQLQKAYAVKYVKEEEMAGETTVLLELVPHKPDVAAQISKIQLWISEDSWLPAQQKFFEAGGDYAIARYSGVKVNRALPRSTFELDAPSNVKRVKMN